MPEISSIFVICELKSLSFQPFVLHGGQHPQNFRLCCPLGTFMSPDILSLTFIKFEASSRFMNPKFPGFFVPRELKNPLDLKIKHFVHHKPQVSQMASIYVPRQPHISSIFAFGSHVHVAV